MSDPTRLEAVRGQYSQAVDRFTSIGNVAVGRGASYVIAASDSETREKEQADVVCDGTSDNVEIQAAIDLLTNGGLIKLLSGTFIPAVDGSIIFDENIYIQGVGKATVIDASSMTSNLFETSKSDGWSHTTSLLTGDATSGDITLDVVDGSIYTAEDWIKLVDDETAQGALKKGEIVRVKSISTNELTLYRKINFSYATADNAYTRELDMEKNITLSNLKINGPGIETNLVAFEGYLINKGKFENVELNNFGLAGFRLWDGVDIYFDKCRFNNIYYTGFGYGVTIVNACENINISKSTFRKRGRHYIATGGATGSYLSGGYFNHLNIKDNYFEGTDSGQEAVNVHEDSNGNIEILGNTFVSCGKGIELQNVNGLITNNTFKNCGNPIYLAGSVDMRYKVSENIIPDGTLYIGTNNVDIEHNDLTGVTVTENGSPTGIVYHHNTGFVTNNKGTATVANGSTTIVVNHGLGITPTAGNLHITPIETLNNASFFWVDTITSTQFTINLNGDPGADVDFAWRVDD